MEPDKSRQKAMLEEQKERDKSELQVLEEGLGIKIEGVDSESWSRLNSMGKMAICCDERMICGSTAP